MMKRRLVVALVAHFVVLFPHFALGDYIGSPSVEFYRSPSANRILTVYPGLSPTEDGACRGRLERRTPEGGWETIWKRELLNPIAPSRVLVADSTDYVVTIDDWGRLGGVNTVVIYGAGGELVRRLALTDILSPEHIRGLWGTGGGSKMWGLEHRLSPGEDYLVLRVRRPRREGLGREFEERFVRLSDGSVESR